MSSSSPVNPKERELYLIMRNLETKLKSVTELNNELTAKISELNKVQSAADSKIHTLEKVVEKLSNENQALIRNNRKNEAKSTFWSSPSAASGDVGDVLQYENLLSKINKLSRENVSLSNDLKRRDEELNTLTKAKELLHQENVKTKLNLIKEKQIRQSCESRLQQKEEELKVVTEKFTKIDTNFKEYKPNNYISKIFEAENLLRKFHEKLSTIESKFGKELQNKRREYNEKLEKYISRHEESKNNLTKSGIALTSDKFPNLVDNFKILYRKNDEKIKNTFKMMFEIKQNPKLNFNEANFKSLEDITQNQVFIEKQFMVLEELQKISFEDDLDQESKSFNELIQTAEEEIDLYINLSETKERIKARPTQSRPGHHNLNNLYRPPSSVKINKSVSCNDLNKNLYDPDRKSLIMFNIPESATPENDLLKIKYLLSRLNIKEVDEISVIRMGRKKDNNQSRATIVNFPNERIPTLVLERFEAGVPWIIDAKIRIERFYSNFKSEKF